MKKVLLFIAFACISSFCYAQAKDIKVGGRKLKDDTIVWRSDSSLAKEDFHAKKSGNVAGFSCVGILLYPQETGGTIIFKVEAFFIKSRSYLIDNSPYTLKHEQLHFDICELYARKLRKMIKDKDFRKVHDIVGEIRRMYTKVSADMEKEQIKYDNDAEHGLNPAKQKVWDATVPQQLQELSDYTAIAINVER